MRVIVRKERPHPGAQLRITDIDGNRITAFATNTSRGQLADLELRHRRRARAEDRIRIAKDTGLTNLPLHALAQNEIWCAIVALACELTAWLQMLALPGDARRWEPKTAAAAAVLHRRTTHPLRTTDHAAPPGAHAWTRLLIDAVTTLRSPRHRTRLTTDPPVPTSPAPPPGPVEPGEPSATRRNCHTHRAESKINTDQRLRTANP